MRASSSGITAQMRGVLLKEIKWDEWMRYEDLIAKIAPLVPPGQALRTYEFRYADGKRRREEANKLKPKKKTLAHRLPLQEKNEKIFSGARAIVSTALTNMERSGLIEFQGASRSPDRLVRRVDRRQQPCPVCRCRADGTKVESDE